jgi:hypothetical protein
MGAWDFARIKTYLIGAGALWALLAFVAWHYESTCGMFLSGACWATYWDGLRHVLLLKWVWDFQTLVAGVLTLIGAFAVMYTAWYKINETRKDESDKRRRDITSAYIAISDEFAEAAKTLATHKDETSTQYDIFKITPDLILTVSGHNPVLTSIIKATMSDARKALSAQKTTNNAVAARCYIIRYLIDAESVELSDVDVRNSKVKMRSGTDALFRQMQYLKVKRGEVGLLADYIDWPT